MHGKKQYEHSSVSIAILVMVGYGETAGWVKQVRKLASPGKPKLTVKGQWG